MRRLALLLVLLLVTLTLVPSTACRIYEPANKPLDNCVQSCRETAKRECSEDECRRGCEFIIDRLVEREGKHVIACVAKNARRCTDVVWADCASRIGVHADGGPPAPAVSVDED